MDTYIDANSYIIDDEVVKQQAARYLLSTDFKALNSTLTAEQIRLRGLAKVVLNDSFVEPPSDLFDV